MATTKRSMTTAARLARIERALETLTAQAPAVSAPASAQAKSPSEFVSFLHERAASKVACEIHPASACNRKFTPKSSGRQGHVARLV